MAIDGSPKADQHLLPLAELQEELTALENGSFTVLSDRELQKTIGIIHGDFRIEAPIFPAGTALYRAVRVSQRPASKSRVGYPPIQAVTQNGRLNKAGEVMFYGSFNIGSCLQECSWQVGEFFAVSGWITTAAITFNHLGYSTAVLEALKSNRDLPSFAVVEKDTERNALIRAWQARVFTQRVERVQEHLYRLPIALKDLVLSKMVQTDSNLPDIFSGVLYPSVAMWLLADNVAILPKEVDDKLDLFEVILLTLDSVTELRKDDGSIETKMNLKFYDFARPTPSGTLIWGQRSQIVLPDGADLATSTLQVLPPA
jgi:hypothetical protein